MKSVKPGRGPSLMGVWGSVMAVVFGIFWTAMTATTGAPSFFPIFGVLFILTGVISGAYNLKNAVSKNRYSAFDVTDAGEEPDPLEMRFGAPEGDAPQNAGGAGYCPYCGAAAEEGYAFCRRCGKRLPDDPA